MKGYSENLHQQFPLKRLLLIGILVQFGWEASLLLGGIRSAAITAWDDKLITLLVNSLLETNLGMPYVYVLYLLYSSRFTEQSPPPVKRVARDAGSKPALLGCASRRWLSLLCHGKSTLRSLPMAPFKPHCY